MAIVDKIHDLTKKMTGQDGVGSDITAAINDLTAKWTQSAGKGSNIEESIANLSLNASSGGGGGGDFSTATVTVTGEGGELYVPNILTTDDTSFAYPLYDSDVLTVILYKGKCMILSHDTKMSSTDETFELLYPNGTVAMITGDCTITLSAS